MFSLNFPASNLDSGSSAACRATLLTTPSPTGLYCPLISLAFVSVRRFLPSRFLKMPVTASRAVLRQSQFLTRRTAVRHASSTSEAASKASESASSAASKASQGLSRVSSSAGPAIGNAAQGVGNALKKVGGRTGKVISFVECKQKLFSGYFGRAVFVPWAFEWVGCLAGAIITSPAPICLPPP